MTGELPVLLGDKADGRQHAHAWSKSARKRVNDQTLSGFRAGLNIIEWLGSLVNNISTCNSCADFTAGVWAKYGQGL